MKKVIVILIMLIIFITTCSSENGTDENNTEVSASEIGYVEIEEGSRLNLRSGPNEDSEIIEQLVRDEKIAIIEFASETEHPGWLKVISPSGADGYVAEQYVNYDRKNDDIVGDEIESGYARYTETNGMSLIASSTWKQVGGEQEYAIALERGEESFRIVKRGRGSTGVLVASYLEDVYKPINYSVKEFDKICNLNVVENYNFQIDRQSQGEIRYFTAFGDKVPVHIMNNTIEDGANTYIETYIETDFYHNGSNYFMEYTGKLAEGKDDEIEKILATLEDEKYEEKELDEFCASLTEKKWTFIDKEKNKMAVEFVPDAEDRLCGTVYVNGECIGAYFAWCYQEDDDSIYMDFCVKGSYYGYTAPGHCYSSTSIYFNKKKCEIYAIDGEGSDNTYILK